MVDMPAEDGYPCVVSSSAQGRAYARIMNQLPLIENPFWTVTSLTLYLRDLFENDEALQDLWVQGEISNFTRAASGHLYFTIKDSGSALKCVMWRSQAGRLKFAPRDGLAIEAHGSIRIYEAQGQYQLYADALRPAGEGALYQEFLRLKARLEAEGLFDPERKRLIPDWPQRIGIVTSPTGAALQDMLNTIRRRFPLVEVIIAPSSVQGSEAPAELIAALDLLNKDAQPDVILLARGGGSIEDLWAFNDENLARAIAASLAPVITGVGHETDFTIADFVSDLRAPTPTAAAELATPTQEDLRASIEEYRQTLARLIDQRLIMEKSRMDRFLHRLALRSPETRIRSHRQSLDEANYRLRITLLHTLRIKQGNLSAFEKRLHALNPSAILQRGYAALRTTDAQPVRSVAQVSIGDILHARLADGKLAVEVNELFHLDNHKGQG